VQDASDPRPIILMEVSSSANKARQIIALFSLAAPVMAGRWQQVDQARSDIPALIAEIIWLRERLAACRIDRANLAAAARVTIAAYRNGEPDPLSYLHDELNAQGFGVGQGEA
jgi:hypothetical protein